MSKFVKSVVSVILVIIFSIAVSGCSASSNTPANSSYQPTSSSSLTTPKNGLVQSNSEGAVTIAIKWMGIKDGSLLFDVSMDTHSVDLDQYDLGKLAVLRDDEGNEYRPISWRSPPGGHHRSGALAFSLPASLSQGKVNYLELVIKDVAGIKERVLRWEF